MSDALKQIWEKVDQMIGPQRMETEAEHIARDMREGRFPKRSDPIQVPVAGPAAARHLAPGDGLVAQATAALEGVTEGRIFVWHHKDASLNARLWSESNDAPANFPATEYVPAALAAARLSALTATVAELERQVPRFPDHMAQIVAAKNERLPERLQSLIAAIEAIPEYMRQYQWQADAKQAFGSKWVRAIAGDNGRGMGRQAIAEVVGHIDVADYIAAANPDTVSMLIAENAQLRDRLARMEGDQERIMRIAAGLFPGGYDNNLAMIRAALTESPADGGSNG